MRHPGPYLTLTLSYGAAVGPAGPLVHDAGLGGGVYCGGGAQDVPVHGRAYIYVRTVLWIDARDACM